MPAIELTRAEVVGRLAAARTVWLATSAPGGGPRSVPVWAAAVDGVLHLFSARDTRKARDVAAEPRVAVHLPDPEDVLVVHGRLVDVGGSADVPHVVAAFAAAYPDPADAGWLPGADPSVDVVYALVPTRAMAWRLEDFTGSQRRWTAA